MHEGWEYVAAAYGITAVTLAVWFWMIGAKLRRLRQAASQEVPRG